MSLVDKNEVIVLLRHLHEMIRILESQKLISTLDSNLDSNNVSTLLSKARQIVETLISDDYKHQKKSLKMDRILSLTKVLNQVVILLEKLRDFFICKQFIYYKYEHIIQTRSAA